MRSRGDQSRLPYIFRGDQFLRGAIDGVTGHFPAEARIYVFNHASVVSGLSGSCRDLSFVSCHWSCLQARSAHNGMTSWREGFCTFISSFLISSFVVLPPPRFLLTRLVERMRLWESHMTFPTGFITVQGMSPSKLSEIWSTLKRRVV